MDIKEFNDLPVFGIIRGIELDDVLPLTEAVIAAGLKSVEITMNTREADVLIKKMVEVAGNRLTVGAGTVLSVDDLKRAMDSGATFCVSPVLINDLVDYCVKKSIPVFPGAFTPQEVYDAYLRGATMVKVFPAKFFGPAYIRELKGPLDKIKLLACGGVTPDTVGDYFSCGASAVAFGASIFRNEWIRSRDFSSLRESVSELVSRVRDEVV